MIKGLPITNETKESEIRQFIFNNSPFTSGSEKLDSLIDSFFKHKMDTPITISMNDKITNQRGTVTKLLFFLVWIGYSGNNKTLYAGTEYINESEFATGINLSRYEV